MEKQIKKRHPTIACCGIDCGLCPRYYTEGKSRCPGCMGEDFLEKHPSCSIVTCCVKKNGFETCAECHQLPCERIVEWDGADSFVSHKKSLENLRQIKAVGMEEFIRQQNQRMMLLNKLIQEYDEGKSKSFFCLAAALMEIEDLNEVVSQMKAIQDTLRDKKRLAKQAKSILERQAQLKGVKLIYRREKT
ncbi:MAG: DUF3795 domain-containing protein [Bacteroidota bacterium]